MLVLLHVLIALSSLIYTGYVFFSPSRNKIYGAYGFIAATLISGSILVYVTHANLISACITGLFYLGVVAIGIAASHRKLSKHSSIE